MTKYRENLSTEGIEQIQAKQGKKKKKRKNTKTSGSQPISQIARFHFQIPQPPP
jgi:hypothetical protein